MRATPEELKTYANAIINARENGDKLLAVLPDHIKSQVVEYIGSQGQSFGMGTPTAEKPTIQNFGTSDKPDYRQYNTTTGQWESVQGNTSTTTPTTGV